MSSTITKDNIDQILKNLIDIRKTNDINNDQNDLDTNIITLANMIGRDIDRKWQTPLITQIIPFKNEYLRHNCRQNASFYDFITTFIYHIRSLVGIDGYRYLETNEIIISSDEVFSWKIWVQTCNNDDKVGSNNTCNNLGWPLLYRRKIEIKIDPGEGYRLLKDDEVIHEGDEYKNYKGEWCEVVDSIGSIPKKWIDNIMICGYRRKIDIYASRQKYIFLQEGDVVQKGDEYMSSKREWNATSAARSIVKEYTKGLYRRPIK